MKTFKPKIGDNNIGKLYTYAVFKFPHSKHKIDYDEVGRFIMFKKDETTTIFYYVRYNGALHYNVYKGRVPKIDKSIITDFWNKEYSDEKLMRLGDKLFKPFTT